MFSDFKREPESVGEAIKRHLGYYSLSLKDASQKMQISQKKLRDVIGQKERINIDLALHLERLVSREEAEFFLKKQLRRYV